MLKSQYDVRTVMSIMLCSLHLAQMLGYGVRWGQSPMFEKVALLRTVAVFNTLCGPQLVQAWSVRFVLLREKLGGCHLFTVINQQRLGLCAAVLRLYIACPCHHPALSLFKESLKHNTKDVTRLWNLIVG